MRGWALVGGVVLACGLAGQTVTSGDPMYVRMRAVGEKLKCQCSCPYTVGSCNMLNCHFRDQVNPQIRADLTAGVDETTILGKLRAKYGTVILAAPPAEGFNVVGWVMPFAALAGGLLLLRRVMLRWRRPKAALAPAGMASEKYREQIEKELADLE